MLHLNHQMVIFRTTTVTSYYTALNVGNTAEQIQLHSCLWIVFLPVRQILQNNAPTETHGAHKLEEHADPTCKFGGSQKYYHRKGKCCTLLILEGSL